MEGQRPRHQQRVVVYVLASLLAFGVVLLSSPNVDPAYAERCMPIPGGYECEGGEDPGPGPGPGDPDPGPGDPPPRQPHDIFYTPACLLNGPPPNGGDAMCSHATMACEDQGGGTMMRIYYQWEPNGPWELVDTRCVGGDNPPPEPVITPDMVENWLRTGWLPKAAVAVNPGNGRTLVGLPTICYAEGATTYEQTHPVPGGSVRVEARATSFRWTWGDGSGDTTSSPGRAYSRGTPMSSYVTHEYQELGEYQIGLEVTWSVDFWINGAAQAPLTVEIAGTPSPPVTVLEKEDVLGQR